jgi:membrane associated rhomboid family serine protease
MRTAYRETRNFLSQFLTPGVQGILIANVVVFFLIIVFCPFSKTATWAVTSMIEVPALSLGRLCVWQFFTYMFVHSGFTHILFNMLALWFFGPRLEYRWGTRRFMTFYLGVGVGAGLFHALFSYMTGRPESAIVGASGAIYGLLLATALYYPDDKILLYFAIPIKMKHFMILMGLVTFFSSFNEGGSEISHITHLGGILVALVWLKGGDWIRRIGPKGPRRVKVRQVDPSRHPDFR